MVRSDGCVLGTGSSLLLASRELWEQRPEDGASCSTAQVCRLCVCPQACTHP